jgi:serine/threonine-protein kinase
MVALKVLHTHRWDDEEMLTRFRQEAKVGAMLKHPNIVPILDAFPGGTNRAEPPWIAMTYVEGETLDAHMQAHGPLPVTECLSIGLDLAEALAHAHTFGVVHRDLKPANVMLQQGHARVMDLGIARVLDSATVTSTYSFLGTPGYAAPEAQKRSHVGPAADRYSLGIILFEMLTGTPPFEGETPFEVLDRHRAHPLPDIRTIRKDVPQVLTRLVERLSQKDPDLRPEDLEVIKILRELKQAG